MDRKSKIFTLFPTNPTQSDPHWPNGSKSKGANFSKKLRILGGCVSFIIILGKERQLLIGLS